MEGAEEDEEAVCAQSVYEASMHCNVFDAGWKIGGRCANVPGESGWRKERMTGLRGAQEEVACGRLDQRPLRIVIELTLRLKRNERCANVPGNLV